MSIFPKKWQGRLIPTDNIPKSYIKNGITYDTKTNKEIEDMEVELTNEDYQNQLLKDFRKEADFVNKFYGLTDKDHFASIELGHIYELMKEYKNSSK